MQTKSVNYQALHALSIKVIQSQQAEIDALKKNQEALANKQSDLEKRMMELEAKLKWWSIPLYLKKRPERMFQAFSF